MFGICFVFEIRAVSVFRSWRFVVFICLVCIYSILYRFLDSICICIYLGIRTVGFVVCLLGVRFYLVLEI